MRGSNKFIFMLLALVLVVVLSACSPKKVEEVPEVPEVEEVQEVRSSPTKRVDKFFDDFKEGQADVEGFLGVDNLLAEDNTEDVKNEALEQIIRDTTYTVNSEKIDGDQAVVNVTVKEAFDADTLMNQYLFEYIKQVEATDLTEEQKNEKGAELLNLMLQDPPVREATGDFLLTFENDEWMITNGRELTTLMFNMNDELLDSIDPDAAP